MTDPTEAPRTATSAQTAPRTSGPTISASTATDPTHPGEGMRLSPPVGDIRNPLTVVLLSIITLGIYALYWHFVMFRDTREFSRHGFGGITGLVLTILLPFLPPFLLPWQVGVARVGVNRDRRVSAVWGLWWLLPIVGWIVWVYAIQGAANELWESHGARVRS